MGKNFFFNFNVKQLTNTKYSCSTLHQHFINEYKFKCEL